MDIQYWGDGEIDAYDCYVDFFGTELPVRKSTEEPNALRHAASSLQVMEFALAQSVLQSVAHKDIDPTE